MRLSAIILALWVVGVVFVANYGYTRGVEMLQGTPRVIRG
jgi:hypothetical protein